MRPMVLAADGSGANGSRGCMFCGYMFCGYRFSGYKFAANWSDYRITPFRFNFCYSSKVNRFCFCFQVLTINRFRFQVFGQRTRRGQCPIDQREEYPSIHLTNVRLTEQTSVQTSKQTNVHPNIRSSSPPQAPAP